MLGFKMGLESFYRLSDFRDDKTSFLDLIGKRIFRRARLGYRLSFFPEHVRRIGNGEAFPRKIQFTGSL